MKVRERIESDLNLRFQVAVWIATVLIGAYSFYLQRYAMNPDAISYIDLGTNFEVSGLWSPAFAWLIGIVLLVFDPTPASEYPLAHSIVFFSFIFSLVTFNLLISQYAFKKVTFLALHLVFLWISLVLIPPRLITPDLFFSAFVFLSAFSVNRILHGGTGYLLLGLSIGLGYLFKTPMLPFGAVLLAIVAFWNWRRTLVSAVISILLISFYAVPISMQLGRISIGENTRLNYLWHVGGEKYEILDEPYRIPVRGTDIEILQYGELANATLPFWYDPPRMWNSEHVEVGLARQGEKLVGNWIWLFTADSRPGLFVLLLIFGFMLSRERCKSSWLLIAPSVLMICLFSLVHLEHRYLAPFIGLIAVATVPVNTGRFVHGFLLSIFLLWQMNGLAFAKDSWFEEGRASLAVYEFAKHRGLHEGQKIASLENPLALHQDWARHGRLRIVGHLFESKSSKNFSNISQDQREEVYKVFKNLGALAIFSEQCPMGWSSVPNSKFCWMDLRAIPAKIKPSELDLRGGF